MKIEVTREELELIIKALDELSSHEFERAGLGSDEEYEAHMREHRQCDELHERLCQY
jgi:hypothetical protein